MITNVNLYPLLVHFISCFRIHDENIPEMLSPLHRILLYFGIRVARGQFGCDPVARLAYAASAHTIIGK